MARIGRLQLAAPHSVAEEMADRDAERHVGKLGERARHLLDGPNIADIGERDEQRRLGLGAAQNAHQRGWRSRRCSGAARRGKERRKLLIGIVAEQAQETRRVGAYEVPQIGRAFGNAADDLRKRGRLVDEVAERLAGSAGRHADQPTRYARGGLRRHQRKSGRCTAFGKTTRGTKPPDQRSFTQFQLRRFRRFFADRRPPHPAPVGPARGRSIMLLRPG